MSSNEKKNMIRIGILLVLLLVIVVVSVRLGNTRGSGDTTKKANDSIVLFNGEDLKDWEVILKDSSANPEETFFVKEGTLVTSGEPFGYIRTKESYSDYNLNVEWRWMQEPGNSGVFLHIQEDGIWPVCLECQLMNGNAGDFVAFPGFTFNEHQDKEKWAVKKHAESSENPAGEWNTYDIRVRGDKVDIFVNGVHQNSATSTTHSKGSIALQSEGAPLQFRNVYLVKK